MTLSSMTGYARLSGEESGLTWLWEAKSVNGKGLEARARVPAGYDFIEPMIRDLAQKRFKRGTLTISLTLTRQSERAALRINEAALEQLVALAQAWHQRAPDLAPARLDGLLALRGVLDSAEIPEGSDPALAPALMSACESVLQQLAEMRDQEGSRLAQILSSVLDEIEGLVAEAVRAVPDRARLREKLQQQVVLLTETGLSEERLAQEIAMVIGKADVREELDRLTAHVAAARDLLAADDAVGRKLDFLCQEFNREANTLCSKASEIEITRIGLSLKAAIEQFREQVQNIE